MEKVDYLTQDGIAILALTTRRRMPTTYGVMRDLDAAILEVGFWIVTFA